MDFPIETDTERGERLRLLGIERDEEGEGLKVEGELEPGAGPPMHMHLHQDEVLRVEEGRIGYQLRDPSGRALDMVEEAARARRGGPVGLRCTETFALLREEPRMQAVAQAVGFPDGLGGERRLR